MADTQRENQQRDWMQDQFHVIVATIAFGMGIDKPDVRFVIHNSVPKSVEAFYQESGRAGRDGEVSYSYLFYSYSDVIRLEKIIRLDKNANAKALEGHFENLHQMAVYCENKTDCRRYLQLLHLGERFDRKYCIQNKETTCDNCMNMANYQSTDVINESREIAQIVKDLTGRENVTMLHVAEIYKGARIKKIVDRGHDKHACFGNGARFVKTDILRIIKQMIFKKFLREECIYTGDFPIVYIKLGPKIRELYADTSKLLYIFFYKNKYFYGIPLSAPDNPTPIHPQ